MTIDQNILDTLNQIKFLLTNAARTTQTNTPPAASNKPQVTQSGNAGPNKNSLQVSVQAIKSLGDASEYASGGVGKLGRLSRISGAKIEQLGSASEELIGSLDAVQRKLKSLDFSSGASALNSAMMNTTSTVSSILTGLSSLSSAALQEKINDVANRLGGIDVSMFSNTLSSVASDIGNVSGALKNVNYELDDLSMSLSGVKGDISNLSDDVQDLSDDVHDAGDSLHFFSATALLASNKVDKAGRNLERRLKNSSRLLGGLNSNIANSSTAFKNAISALNTTPPPPPPPLPPPPPPLPPPPLPKKGYFDEVLRYVKNNQITVQGSINKTLIQQVSYFGQRLKSLGDDIFTSLMPRGISIDASSLLSLNIEAIKSGLSLREYSKMIEESSGVISRAGGISEFNKTLTETNKKLFGLGIFGEDASRLSQTILSGSQSMGIPMDKLGDAATSQAKVFEKLRRTTNMSVEGFSDLYRTVSESEMAQSELLALAPSERAARQAELVGIAGMGASLGLTKNQANQLTQAMFDMRKSTVKQRNEDSQRLSQMFSMVGMSASKAAEASALVKKPKRTKDEEERLATILGEYKQRSEMYKTSNDESLASVAQGIEAGEEKLGGSLRALIDKSGAIQAANESGAQIPKDGKAEQDKSAFAAMIAPYLTTAEGIIKNDAVQVAAAVVIWLSIKSSLGKIYDVLKGGLTGLSGAASRTTENPSEGFFKKFFKKKTKDSTKTTEKHKTIQGKDNTGKDAGGVAEKMKSIFGGDKNCCCCCCPGGTGGSGDSYPDLEFPEIDDGKPKKDKGSKWKRKANIMKRRMSRGVSSIASGAMDIGSDIIEKVKNPRATARAVVEGVKGFSPMNFLKSAGEAGKGLLGSGLDMAKAAPSKLAGMASSVFESGKGMLGTGLGAVKGLGGTLLKKLPMIGNLVTLGMAANDLTNVDEQAKEKGISTGERKGEIIGSAIGSTAGMVAGGALGGIAGPPGIAIGGMIGQQAGEWLGTNMGGLVGKNFQSWFGEKTDVGKAVSSATNEAATAASGIAASSIDTSKGLFDTFTSWFGKDSSIAKLLAGAGAFASSAMDSVKKIFTSNNDATKANTAAIESLSVVDTQDIGSLAANARETAKLLATPAKAEPVKAEPVKAEPVKATVVQATPVKAEPVKAEPVKAEPVKAEPVKAEPVQAILSQPIPAQAKSINQQHINNVDESPVEQQQNRKTSDEITTSSFAPDIKEILQSIVDQLKMSNVTEAAQLEALISMIKTSGKSLNLADNQYLNKLLNA